MIEHREGSLPGIVSASMNWVQHRWNEARWGFPEGFVRRAQMEALLNQETVGLHGVEQLVGLMRETRNSRLQLKMAEKVRGSVDHLIQMDMQALSDMIQTTAREEGLE